MPRVTLSPLIETFFAPKAAPIVYKVKINLKDLIIVRHHDFDFNFRQFYTKKRFILK